jgi:hypothetical protein
MTHTLDLGRRMELMSMDSHCDDITIALYQEHDPKGPYYIVHSYSSLPQAHERVLFISRAMQVMGGLDSIPDNPAALRFPCGAEHLKACRRLFLEACKLDSHVSPETRPMQLKDNKTGQLIRGEWIGNGAYRISGPADAETDRVPVYVNGLAKLAELQIDPSQPDTVRFECGARHDQLIGLLLNRAQNVRAILREQEMLASRGVLAAPSAQQQA